jgi:hypothetical protein
MNQLLGPQKACQSVVVLGQETLRLPGVHSWEAVCSVGKCSVRLLRAKQSYGKCGGGKLLDSPPNAVAGLIRSDIPTGHQSEGK